MKRYKVKSDLVLFVLKGDLLGFRERLLQKGSGSGSNFLVKEFKSGQSYLGRGFVDGELFRNKTCYPQQTSKIHHFIISFRIRKLVIFQGHQSVVKTIIPE